MNDTRMTQAEYARYRGVQKSAVSNWKKAGFLIFAEGQGGRMLIDVARTDARVNANIDPTRGRPTKTQSEAAAGQPELPVQPSQTETQSAVASARVDLAVEQTIRMRLQNAKEAGALVPFVEYQRLCAENGRLARERMVSLVRSNAERLAAERDPRAITALLTAEIEAAFDALAAIAARGEGAPDDDAELQSIIDGEIAKDAALPDGEGEIEP